MYYFDLFPLTLNWKSCGRRARLTAVGVAPLLQVGVAVQAAVGRRDVLRGAGDGRFRHDRVGIRRLVHGLQLQPLVVNPQIGGLQVFGVPLVFVGAVRGLRGGSLSAGGNAKRSKVND